MQSNFSDPEIERKIYLKRVTLSIIFISLLTLILVARYFDLQITKHEDFVTNSEKNRVHVRPLAPARGIIYDRNGEILAHNIPITNLSIVREHTDDLDALINKLKSLIEISDNEICLLYTSDAADE